MERPDPRPVYPSARGNNCPHCTGCRLRNICRRHSSWTTSWSRAMTAVWIGSARCSTRRLTFSRSSFSHVDLVTTLQRHRWYRTARAFMKTRPMGSSGRSTLDGLWANGDSRSLSACRGKNRTRKRRTRIREPVFLMHKYSATPVEPAHLRRLRLIATPILRRRTTLWGNFVD